MIRLPRSVPTDIVKKNLELFASSAAAEELEDQKREWRVVEWSWTPGPPLRIVLRTEEGEGVAVVMDGTGVWRISEEPIAPKIRPMSDISPIR